MTVSNKALNYKKKLYNCLKLGFLKPVAPIYLDVPMKTIFQNLYMTNAIKCMLMIPEDDLG